MLENFNLDAFSTIYEPFFNRIVNHIAQIIDSSDQKYSPDLIYTFCYIFIIIPISKLAEKQILPFKFEKLFLKCDDCLLKSEVKRNWFILIYILFKINLIY